MHRIKLNKKNSDIQMFSIVEFEDRSVSFVPTKWLQDGGKNCFWPTGLDTKKMNLYRQENFTPKKEWGVYSVKRIFCTASTYSYKNSVPLI